MDDRDPVAFISYVRADDEHDHGRITALRERLEGELRMQLGRSFHIFQDKKDIKWGQQWKRRLDETLLNVTFLIPVVTPSYFTSSACRDEFDKFLLREKQLGEDRLILPIYYLSSDTIDDDEIRNSDEMAKIISSRNWADWRKLRFKDLRSAEVESAVSDMAVTIKVATREIDKIIAASKKPATLDETPPPEHIAIKDFPSAPPAIRRKKKPRTLLSEYFIYTTDFDEEISAETLSSPAELKKLSAYLNKTIRQYKSVHIDILSKFQSLLDSVDTSIFALTILIDNSGSMRGRKIMAAAAWSYMIAEILDKYGVSVEVLGYTTRAWKGGQSREMWLMDGKPSAPGRLNDIRHIIYKDRNRKMADIHTNFGLMIREGLLKENIDGESVNWAYNRLLLSEKNKRALIVLSDGAPVDDSTLSVNKNTMLSDHLYTVVEQIEIANEVEIIGIGLEFDCSKFYEKSKFVPDSETLGPALIGAMRELLKQ